MSELCIFISHSDIETSRVNTERKVHHSESQCCDCAQKERMPCLICKDHMSVHDEDEELVD